MFINGDLANRSKGTILRCVVAASQINCLLRAKHQLVEESRLTYLRLSRCERDNMGSPVRLKKVTKSPHFFHQAKCFCGDAEISHLYSIKSGENALVSLYNGKDQNILDNLHCIIVHYLPSLVLIHAASQSSVLAIFEKRVE